MVFQWFSPKSDTMVNNGFGPFQRPKKAHNRHILNFLTSCKLDDREGDTNESHRSCQSSQVILQTEDKIKTVWNFKTTIWYHCKVSMVLKSTITIEWNGLGQPLGSMVFRWFWGHKTIGFDGLRWLSTIGPTMEWLHTIVEV